MTSSKVEILGAEYTITIKKYNEDEAFERDSSSGYCYSHTRQIVVCDMSTYKGWEHEPAEVIREQQKETIRHEIIHAFFNESGLKDSANSVTDSWARNEEMIDWFAIQGPKILKAWQEAGAV